MDSDSDLAVHVNRCPRNRAGGDFFQAWRPNCVNEVVGSERVCVNGATRLLPHVFAVACVLPSLLP